MRDRSRDNYYEIQRINYCINNSILSNTDPVWDKIIEQIKYYEKYRTIPDEPFVSLSEFYPLSIGDTKGRQTGLPDVIYESDDLIIGIEHFEFDSSKRTKKGSRLRKEECIAKSKIDDIIGNNISTEGSYKIGVDINAELTYQYYIDSLFDVFEQHARNIEKYKKSLKQLYPQKDILLAFFIDDITAIGNYIKRNNTVIPLSPNLIPVFLAKLLEYPKIDYIISSFQNMYVPYLHFLRNTQETILTELKKSYNSNDIFVSYHYRIETNIHNNTKIISAAPEGTAD